MDRAREILGVEQEFLGFVDSGLPEGDPLPPLPEGCFALRAARGGRGAAGRADPPLPAAGDHHLRRARRLSAPRPHQDPQDLGGRVRGGRRPRPVPRARASRGSRSKLYYHMGFTRPRTRGAARGDARSRRWSRRTPSGWRTGTPSTTSPHRVTTRVPVRRVLRRPRRGADRARHADRPRRAAGSPARWRSSSRSGRPRTTSWPGRWSTRRPRGRPLRRHPQRGGGPMTRHRRPARRRGRPAPGGRRQGRPARPAADRRAADRGRPAGPLDDHAPQADPARASSPRTTSSDPRRRLRARRPRPAAGRDLLDSLRRAPRAIEPPRDDGRRPAGRLRARG